MSTQSVTLLRDLQAEDRPRERMMQYGSAALSNAELLAILLRTGTFSESALRLAERVLAECGGLRGISGLSRDELTRIKGIGDAKALQIQAGIELGRRMAKSKLNKTVTIRTPSDVAELLTEELRYHQKEHFCCVFLNTKNQVLAYEVLSIGSLNTAIVHPREIFAAAIKRNSASIICVHNHPSGDPTPSKEDIDITERLVEGGRILGIDVLDHVIIGDTQFISLKEQGYL